MNRDQAAELLPIIQAFAEGKDLQIKVIGGWRTIIGDLDSMTSLEEEEWRIKPEPREWTILISDETGEPIGLTGAETGVMYSHIKVREVIED